MSIQRLIKAGAGWLYLNSPSGQRQLKASGTILMLHRVVADDDRAALPHRTPLCIGERAFDGLLEWLGRHFDCVALEVLLEADAPPSGRPRVALTFDDGWRDNATRAFALLKKHRIPASIFLSTDFIDSDRRFWWESVGETLWGSFGDAARERLAQHLHALHLEVPQALRQDIAEQARSLCLAHYLQRLKAQPAKQLQALADSCPHPIEPHALSWQQVRALEASGLVRFGPHGASHSILKHLDDHELDQEIRRSRDALAARCQEPLNIYCYPNGDHDARVDAALLRAGYALALGTRPGLVCAPLREPLALPRIGVSQQTAQRPELLAWRLFKGARQNERDVARQAFPPTLSARGTRP